MCSKDIVQSLPRVLSDSFCMIGSIFGSAALPSHQWMYHQLHASIYGHTVPPPSLPTPPPFPSPTPPPPSPPDSMPSLVPPPSATTSPSPPPARPSPTDAECTCPTPTCGGYMQACCDGVPRLFCESSQCSLPELSAAKLQSSTALLPMIGATCCASGSAQGSCRQLLLCVQRPGRQQPSHLHNGSSWQICETALEEPSQLQKPRKRAGCPNGIGLECSSENVCVPTGDMEDPGGYGGAGGRGYGSA